MQFCDVIKNRTSIKKFKTNKINTDKIDRMINAAMMSPSWKNASSYKLILVEDINKKNSIAEAINNKTHGASQAVKDAPVVAIVVSNPQDSGIVDGKDYYLVDSAIAMEHFILAATDEGYGTCWIGAVDEDKIRSILNIPNNYKVVGLTPVGEIEERKDHYEKKNVRDYVFLDSWDKAYADNKQVLQ